MKFIYEALVIIETNGSYYATIPDLPACSVRAGSYEEAVFLLSDYAEEALSRMLCNSIEPPAPTYGRISYDGYSIATMVLHASDEANYRVISASQAADMLGVSRARVSQMLKKGTLHGYKTGRDSWVYLASVENRLRYFPNRRAPLEQSQSERT